MAVIIGILRDTAANETRVAVVPEIATKLKALGARVLIERGAGVAAHFPDAAYADAEISDAATILKSANVLLTVQPPSIAEVNSLNEGALVIGFMQAYARPDLVRALKQRRITSFAMELVPRISRAQSMDALSSQASVAGYKAVLIAANTLEKFLPMLTTAAGTIRPASVLIIGAGVAGLQAIATARRLGAVVEASVPGRAAPRIISRAAVERMKAGSVVVDIAAEQGGNCELTSAGETVIHGGVKIVGPLNLPASLSYHASEMYARNLFNLLKPALVKGELAIDWNDEVFAGAVLTHDGQIKHEATRKTVEGQST